MKPTTSVTVVIVIVLLMAYVSMFLYYVHLVSR